MRQPRPVYVWRIAIDDPVLISDCARTPLEPGIAVTAQIKAGKRILIDCILSPIAEHAHNALRER